MADISIRGPDKGDDGKGKRGEPGKRGKRGHRGHDGHDAGAAGFTGAVGTIGPTGPTGPTGPAGAADSFQAAFRAPTDPHFPGMPVFIAFFALPGGITTVQQTDVRPGLPQFSEAANVHGIIVSVNADQTVQVRSSGPVTLTETQWDKATGGTGGLKQGNTYYPAVFPALGLTNVAPTKPGAWSAPVGVALDATTLFLVPLGAPTQVLGDSIYFAQNTGTAPPVGTPVFAADADLNVTPAVNNGPLSNATSVGLIAAYSDGTPIVQTTGIVTLTPGEWAAVTDTGGLIPGNSYYVSGSAGILTATRPTKPPVNIALVGTALSKTQFLLCTPAVPIPLS